MGNSSILLKSVFDALVAKGIPDPRGGPSGYGDALALECANQVMADIVCERYNWKWNRATAATIYTNSYQQDYPQPAQSGGPIGWGEDGDVVDINNTLLPKPLRNLKWRRGLSRTNVSRWWPENISWMYNADMFLGTWPGPNVTFYPLVGTSAPGGQNPLLNMVDKNNNILIVTTFGVTGAVAPFLPPNAPEADTIVDGTVTWTCVSPTSQGFRLDRLPSAAGPTLAIYPYYQLDPPRFANQQQKINPIPDSYSRFFYRGLQSELLENSPNPGDAKRGQDMKVKWLNSMLAAKKQGDREINAYALLPAASVVEPYWGPSTPRTADNPYGWN